MQQKSTQKILLFSVAAQKVEKIKVLCKTLGISVQQVEKSDYGQKLGAIAVSGDIQRALVYEQVNCKRYYKMKEKPLSCNF